jgi:hypothetical protein
MCMAPSIVLRLLQQTGCYDTSSVDPFPYSLSRVNYFWLVPNLGVRAVLTNFQCTITLAMLGLLACSDFCPFVLGFLRLWKQGPTVQHVYPVALLEFGLLR